MKRVEVTFYALADTIIKNPAPMRSLLIYSARSNRFPTDQEGQLIYVPEIMSPLSDGDIVYNHIFKHQNKTAHLLQGLRAKSLGSWNWDLSNTLGFNNFHFYGDKHSMHRSVPI